MRRELHLAGDPEADAVLAQNPFALLVGMLLDQQIPMEVAFAGPKKIVDRLGDCDPRQIAAMNPEQFIAVCATPPAVHRFPKSMGQRIHDLATTIVQEYAGDTGSILRMTTPMTRSMMTRLGKITMLRMPSIRLTQPSPCLARSRS